MLDEERMRRDKLEKLARDQEKQLELERALREQYEAQDANRSVFGLVHRQYMIDDRQSIFTGR